MSRSVFRTTFQTIYLLYTCTCSDIVSFNQNTPVWHVTEKGFNPGNLPVKQELTNAKVLIHSQIHEIPCVQVCTPRGVEQWFHPFVIVNPFWSALPGAQICFQINLSLVRTYNRTCIINSNLKLRKLVILIVQ